MYKKEVPIVSIQRDGNVVKISGKSAKIILIAFIAFLNLPFIAAIAFLGVVGYQQHADVTKMLEKESTVEVFGYIVDYETKTEKRVNNSHKTYTVHAAIYEYEIDGTTYTLQNNVWADEIPEIGTMVKIYHDTETGDAVSEESWELN